MEPTLADLIGGALRLDRSAFDAIEQSSQGLRDAFIPVVLAGVSLTLGQSVVLFLNLNQSIARSPWKPSKACPRSS